MRTIITFFCIMMSIHPIVNAMEMDSSIQLWDKTVQMLCNSNHGDMEMLTDNEMDTITGQTQVSVLLKAAEGKDKFEVNLQLSMAAIGQITGAEDKVTGFILLQGPDGENSDVIAEITASVPNNSEMTMEILKSGEKGKDLGGTKAFEIPPYITFMKVRIPKMEYDIYIAEDIKILLDSVKDGKSPNASTLGLLKIYGLDINIAVPKNGAIFIFPS